MTEEKKEIKNEEENEDKGIYLECACKSFDHIVKLSTIEWNWEKKPKMDEVDCYLYVHLCQVDGFFKRCWKAIKYVFKCNERFGHYDEFIFTEEEAQNTVEFLVYFIERKKEIERDNQMAIDEENKQKEETNG